MGVLTGTPSSTTAAFRPPDVSDHATSTREPLGVAARRGNSATFTPSAESLFMAPHADPLNCRMRVSRMPPAYPTYPTVVR